MRKGETSVKKQEKGIMKCTKLETNRVPLKHILKGQKSINEYHTRRENVIVGTGKGTVWFSDQNKDLPPDAGGGDNPWPSVAPRTASSSTHLRRVAACPA